MVNNVSLNYACSTSRIFFTAEKKNIFYLYRFYTFVVGKLNPAKLANFPEIDCYVIVACPENSLQLDVKEFYRPVITPFELEVALNTARTWTGNYITDFRQLLPGAVV